MQYVQGFASSTSRSAAISSTPVAGDVLLAIYAATDTATMTAISGCGATWSTPVGSSSTAAVWMSVGTGTLTTGTV
ncbi:hypothetical protein CWI62_27860, partial [Escherichia coli]